MALAPKVEFSSEENLPILTSDTYKLDWENGRILGKISEEEAIQQFIQKALSTERSKFFAYDDQYGREFEEILSGNYSEALISSELERFITEAIIYDERILEVSDFTFSFTNSQVEVQFQVRTIYGNFYLKYSAV